jgi:GT2 family glycosyltransferase
MLVGSAGHGDVDVSVSIVTLLWRNEAHLRPFMRSLSRSVAAASSAVELIALVNGDDGRAAAAALADTPADPAVRVRVLSAPCNLGFAGGMNRVCRAARADTIVMANLDLEFDEGFVAALGRRAPALDGMVLLAPSVAEPVAGRDGGPAFAEQGVARLGPAHRLRAPESVPPRLAAVPAGNGCCIVVGRPLYERRVAVTGGVFDAEYHSYYEDVDLFWWARDNGVAVLFDPDLRVVHHKGGSYGGQFRFTDRTPAIQVSVMANYRLTVWKHLRTPAQALGWLAGEAGYVALSVRAAGVTGLGRYLRSWREAARRAAAIRRRRGRVRDHAPPAGAGRGQPQAELEPRRSFITSSSRSSPP